MDLCCSLCKQYMETADHLFRECAYTEECWRLVPQHSHPPQGVWGAQAWTQVWKSRNSLIFRKAQVPPLVTVSRALAMAKEWAAYVIVRESPWQIIGVGCSSKMWSTPLKMEIEGMCMGIAQARRMGLKDLHVYSDAQAVVQILQGDLSGGASEIHERPCVRIPFISRFGGPPLVAQILPRHSQSNPRIYVWLRSTTSASLRTSLSITRFASSAIARPLCTAIRTPPTSASDATPPSTAPISSSPATSAARSAPTAAPSTAASSPAPVIAPSARSAAPATIPPPPPRMGDARRLARLEACSGVPARVVALDPFVLSRNNTVEMIEYIVGSFGVIRQKSMINISGSVNRILEILNNGQWKETGFEWTRLKGLIQTFSSSSSSLFSTLPKSNPKKVVQVKLPLHPSLLRPPIDDEDDEDDEKPSKPAKESRSGPPSKKFSLPPPKHSLCLAPPPSSDPLRRTAAVSVEADAPPPAIDLVAEAAVETADYGGVYANYEGYGGGWDAATELPGVSDWVPTAEAGYGYEGGVGGAEEAEPEMPENLKRLGKRGRGGISVSETVVVRQADLMKDRPREDQLKATGIAFGPAYQPVSSAKGKPSKLHKRKHQIGSLYFDMKQKEMELEERRSKGFLTKAETQAKYGW
ncbi:hypothetical protein QJS04_geneDACA004087 [Acorus gramineus]|uniref:Uncharacterized protein n=1 Tax=Acorus gramineus TaxID=55184 RepID=A0AAV9BIH2_ACOGR|nr:hypothetical protein QJS04_geneDACA004087 [Acorus gramineus]